MRVVIKNLSHAKASEVVREFKSLAKSLSEPAEDLQLYDIAINNVGMITSGVKLNGEFNQEVLTIYTHDHNVTLFITDYDEITIL